MAPQKRIRRKQSTIRMIKTKKLLTDIVKEKGVADIIMEYAGQIETNEVKDKVLKQMKKNYNIRERIDENGIINELRKTIKNNKRQNMRTVIYEYDREYHNVFETHQYIFEADKRWKRPSFIRLIEPRELTFYKSRDVLATYMTHIRPLY